MIIKCNSSKKVIFSDKQRKSVSRVKNLNLRMTLDVNIKVYPKMSFLCDGLMDEQSAITHMIHQVHLLPS